MVQLLQLAFLAVYVSHASALPAVPEVSPIASRDVKPSCAPLDNTYGTRGVYADLIIDTNCATLKDKIESRQNTGHYLSNTLEEVGIFARPVFGANSAVPAPDECNRNFLKILDGFFECIHWVHSPHLGRRMAQLRPRARTS